MRKKLMLAAVICLSAAWAMAQQPAAPGAPAGSSEQNATQNAPAGQSAPGAQSGADQSATPGAQPGAAQSSSPVGAVDMAIVQGCLGGTNPNYTLTDKKGTTYMLLIPPNKDASVLSKHIGEAVAVMGVLNPAGGGSGAAASSPSASGGTSGAATANSGATGGAASSTSNDAGAAGGISSNSTPKDSSAASSSQQSIQVARIGRGTADCPAGASKPQPPQK